MSINTPAKYQFKLHDERGGGEISGREILCIIWSAPIGITDGSFAAEKVPGCGDKIFRARHQPRPGKLDSSGVGKPPLLLRRWGKVIREWDLCKAKEKRLYFQDFVRRDTRWIPNRISPPPSFIRRGNNFCNKIDVTGINIFISPCNRFFYPRSCTYDYPDNLSLLLSLYIYFFPIFSFLIIIFQSLVHQFRWLRRYLRRFATPREEKKKEKYRCWFMVDGRVGEFMRVG